MKRHEKILKELEKKLEWEKNRTEKLTESLRNKEEEAKDLGKVSFSRISLVSGEEEERYACLLKSVVTIAIITCSFQ